MGQQTPGSELQREQKRGTLSEAMLMAGPPGMIIQVGPMSRSSLKGCAATV